MVVHKRGATMENVKEWLTIQTSDGNSLSGLSDLGDNMRTLLVLYVKFLLEQANGLLKVLIAYVKGVGTAKDVDWQGGIAAGASMWALMKTIPGCISDLVTRAGGAMGRGLGYIKELVCKLPDTKGVTIGIGGVALACVQNFPQNTNYAVSGIGNWLKRFFISKPDPPTPCAGNDCPEGYEDTMLAMFFNPPTQGSPPGPSEEGKGGGGKSRKRNKRKTCSGSRKKKNKKQKRTRSRSRHRRRRKSTTKRKRK